MRRLKLPIINLLLIGLALYFGLAFAVGVNVLKDDSVKSDAIFVLGARAYLYEKYNPCLKARVDHAVNLYKQNKAKKLVFSGGTDKEDDQNEAEVMKKIALEQGIHESDILLEKASTSTFENFSNSLPIFKSNNINSIIIVTEPFHTPRAKLIANKMNLNYTVSPAVESSCWTQNKYLSRYFLKEPLAIFEYKLNSRI